MEKTFMEKIDSHTLLLKSCIVFSYFESTISDSSVASILCSLWFIQISILRTIDIGKDKMFMIARLVNQAVADKYKIKSQKFI